MPRHQMQDSDITFAVNNCLSAARRCLEAFHYCLDEKGTAFSGKHLSLLQVCVETCQLTARLLVSEMPYYHQASELCFEVTLACAIECERYEYDDVFKQAAIDCRRCAESCRMMTGASTHLAVAETKSTPLSSRQ